MGDNSSARTPRSETSGMDAKRIDRREMVGNSGGSSWGSSEPNFSGSEGISTGADFAAVVYHNTSASTGTKVDIISGQVDWQQASDEGSGGHSMGSKTGVAVVEIGEDMSPCGLAKPCSMGKPKPLCYPDNDARANLVSLLPNHLWANPQTTQLMPWQPTSIRLSKHPPTRRAANGEKTPAV